MKALAISLLLAVVSTVASAADPAPGAEWIGKTVVIKPSKEGSSCIRVEKFIPTIGQFNKAAPDTCTFKVAAGSAPGTVSFESVSEPGLFIQHHSLHLVLRKDSGDDSMFRIVAPLRGNQGLSFQSYNYPTHHITVVDREGLDIVKDIKEPRKAVFYIEERK